VVIKEFILTVISIQKMGCKIKRKLLFWISTIFILSLPSVFAVTSCGDVITTDLTLTNDVLNCDAGNGLVLNASDITLDCNGFQIHSGTKNNHGILIGELSDRATIQNCEIINFNNGIGTTQCIKNMTGVTIKDTLLNNNSINLDLEIASTCNSYLFYDNLTMSNVDFFTAGNYGLGLGIISSNLNDLEFTCVGDVADGDCETTAFIDDMVNSTIDGWVLNNGWQNGISLVPE